MTTEMLFDLRWPITIVVIEIIAAISVVLCFRKLQIVVLQVPPAVKPGETVSHESATLGVVQQVPPAVKPGTALCAFLFLLIASLCSAVGYITYSGASQTGTAQSGPVADPSIIVTIGACFLLLVLILSSLVLLFKALGLADSTAALGLPHGSLRGLLAAGLVIIFIATASAYWASSDNNGTQKQIFTIASTAFTTIMGFYFGSKGAADAHRAAKGAADATHTDGKKGAPGETDPAAHHAENDGSPNRPPRRI
jgi:hypothetical protein